LALFSASCRDPKLLCCQQPGKSEKEKAVEAGYLGVGAMGQPMAHKLLDAGHGLTIYDINEAAMQPLLERQARRANSPRELADRCEIVFVSLPTLAAFREVAFGTRPAQRISAACRNSKKSDKHVQRSGR
jgi:3-hydroxyisobutyrate dehydrogenase-like beta-hydroxyacid dehydrogenase